MTKYILHGGTTRDRNADNDSFFREMTVGLSGKVRVLLNYFSREEGEWEKLMKEDRARLVENSSQAVVEVEVAHLHEFTKQLQNADAMFMRGGSTSLLMSHLSHVADVANLFEGKVIAGSSAGMYILCKYYRENSTGKLGKGLGVFPFKGMAHYRAEKTEAMQELWNYGERLPVLALPDYKWVVMYK